MERRSNLYRSSDYLYDAKNVIRLYNVLSNILLLLYTNQSHLIITQKRLDFISLIRVSLTYIITSYFNNNCT